MLLNLALVLLGVVLNAGAQVALKFGIAEHAGQPLGTILSTVPTIMLRPWVLLGLTLYVASVVNWLLVLSRMDLAIAYPMMSMAYILTWLSGMMFFNEPYSHTRLAGLFIIIVGIVVITRPVAQRPALPEAAIAVDEALP